MKLKGLLFRKLFGKTEEKEVELPGVKIGEKKVIVEIPSFKNEREVNVIYPLIEMFAYAHIHWDDEKKSLIYELIEPELNEDERKKLKIISDGLIDLVEIELSKVKKRERAIEYLQEQVKKVMEEFNLKLTKGEYVKIMYYIYRDFIGLGKIEPLMRDPNIEDLACDGVGIPIYVVHRRFGSIRTNVVFNDLEELRDFVIKLAERCGRYVSYAEPILDGTLPDGSRVAATLAGDVATKGPTFCVTDGYIQFFSGELIPIKEFYDESKTVGELGVKDGVEIVKPKLTYATGVDSNLIHESSRIKYVMKLPPPEKLVRVELDDGKVIEVTLNHMFHIVNESGIRLLRADELKEGMYLPIPTKIKVRGRLQQIKLTTLLSECPYRVCLKVNDEIKRLVKEFLKVYTTKKGIDRKRIGKEFKVNEGYFYDIISNKSRSISSSVFLRICNHIKTRLDLNEIDIILKTRDGYGGGKYCKIPLVVNEDLAYVLGLIVSDGTVRKDYISISLAGEDEKTKQYVLRKLRKVFGKGKLYKDSAIVCNKFISWYITHVFGIPTGKKARNVGIPELILKSNKRIVRAFLRGLFDGDGSSVNSLNLKTYSRKLAYQLPFVLARFGIYSKVTKDSGYRVLIPRIYESRFFKEIGFSYPRKIRELKRRVKKKPRATKVCSRIPTAFVKRFLQENGFSLCSISRGIGASTSLLYKDTISKENLRKILKFVEKNAKSFRLLKVYNHLKWLLNSNYELIRIRKVEIINENKKGVYDIELNPVRFYVGGVNGPLIIFDSIRKFREKPFSPTELIELKTASPEMMAYLWYIVEHRASLLVAGGVASGKTSFLNSISMFIPPESKIVSIEDTRELMLPHEHWVPVVTRVGFGIPLPTGEKYGEITLFDLLKESFRQNPDYVIVGEVRGKEAYVMFQAMASGNTCWGTFHAGSVDTIVKRLITPPIELSPTLVETLDCTVIMTHAKEKGKSARRVKEIIEIKSIDESGRVEGIKAFEWDPITDTYKRSPKSYLIEKLARAKGESIEDAYRELEIRKKVIEWMFNNGIK
ncbi:MAG TPA: hypothetical protein ENG45_01370, partial [Candidatus Aenigmarchaeota archaeon]|nr:hypothetical protein [Candidatus Aenigmarchaeota archaeon]